MEKFRYEIPSIERKQEAIDYIKEFYEYNYEINGTWGLQRYLDNYEGWLEKLEREYYEDSEYHTTIQDYIINVDESLENHKEEYE